MWPAILAAMGLLQNLNKQDQYQRDARLAAETTRMMPFTGMRGQLGERPPPGIADALGGALQGAQVANAFEDRDLDRQLKEMLAEKGADAAPAGADLGLPELQRPTSVLYGEPPAAAGGGSDLDLPDLNRPASVLYGDSQGAEPAATGPSLTPAPRPRGLGKPAPRARTSPPSSSLYRNMARRLGYGG